MDGLNKRKINELVDENYVYASVLYYFGIEFYDYSEHTLEQVCKEKGLNVQAVTDQLESISRNDDQVDLTLISCPVDLIIEYLKHAHYLFIKQKLPYIAKLIEEFETDHEDFKHIARDLKFVFPLFVEDFIHHIYQEEDTLFSYILSLNRFVERSRNHSEVFFQMEEHSIQRFSMEHDAHDDEMRGIAKITNNYDYNRHTPLHVRVIYEELKSFEKNLVAHAKVENEILFPKALLLEKQVKEKFSKIVSLN
ncbi:MAG: hemerythrin domain-containing protein [Bacteroidota bacterium]